jgi:hypothetical protein
MICTLRQTFLGDLQQGEQDGQGLRYAIGRTQILVGFWWWNFSERCYLEDLSVNESNIKIVFKNKVKMA